MANELLTMPTTHAHDSSALTPQTGNKDSASRLRQFKLHLAETNTPWYKPDFAAYRDKLAAEGKAPATCQAYLATVRTCYRHLLLDPKPFYELARLELERTGQVDDPANRAAVKGAIVDAIKGAIDPMAAPVKTTTIRDKMDSQHLRLTKSQASALLSAPGGATLLKLRDTALLGLMLCTGIREAEACALDVGDLREYLEGELCLLVRKGKGRVQRGVLYGPNDWILPVIDKWLAAAGITEGAVFRSIWRGGKLRGRLSARGLQEILKGYPVMVDGTLTQVRPHDLRRTFAKRCHSEGQDVLFIQANMGHADLKTTLGYIGELDAERRRPPVLYDFDLVAFLANGQDRLL